MLVPLVGHSPHSNDAVECASTSSADSFTTAKDNEEAGICGAGSERDELLSPEPVAVAEEEATVEAEVEVEVEAGESQGKAGVRARGA